MSISIDKYRRLIQTECDAVRWACALEALAPKVGNVHVTASFSNLSVGDFIKAGDILADCVSRFETVGDIVLATIQEVQARSLGNVNLGIALLIAPLALSARHGKPVTELLLQLSPSDSTQVYSAIQLAKPGGIGTSSEMDVNGPAPPKLMDAMRVAESWDLIARQYANGFDDVFQFIIPCLLNGIRQEDDMLLGIRRAQIAIMSVLNDTLIARKCGEAVANETRLRTARILEIENAEQRFTAECELDYWLRDDGNRRNPGAIADLIAAGLFELLRPKSP